MKQKIYFEAKAKKSKSPIEKVVTDLGINYPNESLGFLHAIYAKVDGKTPNKNRVILAKTVKDDVPQLRFTQANINHKRQGYVIGTILDAWVNEDEQIEIVFSFFKSLYPKEWGIVEKAIEEDEMSVSFELMVENDDVVHMADGVRKLKRVSFDGVGLLFPGVPPAYPDAKVLQSANAIVNNVFDNKKNLICASVKEAVEKIEKALIEKEEASYKCECLKCGNIISSTEHCKDTKCSKCGREMRRYDRPSKQNIETKEQKGESIMDKKTQEALLAEFKKDVIAELGEEAVKDWSDEQWEAELKKRAEAEDKTEPETTEASNSEAEESKEEDNSEEASDEESEEKVEEAEKEESKEEEKVESKEVEKEESSEENAEMYKVEEETKMKQTREVDSETMEEKITTEAESVVKVNDEIKQVRKQLEEVLFKAEELEKQLEEKDKEIAFLKENAKKVVEIRAELGDFVKDLSDNDLLDENKLENARLKKRVHDLENKDIETANEEKEEDLKTGHEEAEKKEDTETSDDRIGQYLKNKYGK